MVKLVLVTGKGGVGKTTTSSSIAVWAARQGYQTLLASSDPAHSTRDTFGQMFKPVPQRVDNVPNLWAVEVNPERMASSMSESLNDSFDSPLMKMMGFQHVEQSSMMLPGLDELVAFEVMLKYVQTRGYDLVVFDTAPTGHTLRFLSLPSLLEQWLDQMEGVTGRMDILSGITGKKYDRSLEIREMKQKVRQIERLLSNPKFTAFYIVLIPEKLAVEESRRTKKTLDNFNMPVRGCIINNIYEPRDDCDQCSARVRVQNQYMGRIEKIFEGDEVAKVPFYTHEVQGLDALEIVGDKLMPQLDIQPVKAVISQSSESSLKVRLWSPGVKKEDITIRRGGNDLVVTQYGCSDRIPIPFEFNARDVKAKMGDRDGNIQKGGEYLWISISAETL